MENEKDFKGIEQKIFQEVLTIGRERMKEALEAYDQELRRSRDTKVLRHKGNRSITIGTIMGEVVVRRSVYLTPAGKRGYLLDEALHLKENGFASELVCEKIAGLICTGSYRATAAAVTEMTGLRISHTSVWNIVQSMGENAAKQEDANTKAAKENAGKGTIETPVLFEEQDGIYLPLQGADRARHGSSKEMKLSIAYDGWEKKGKIRYQTTNKVATASFESAELFSARKEGTIAATYNVDEIQWRVLNADGAEWAKRSIDADNVIYQLDPFHRNKAIRENVPDKEVQSTMFKLLYSKDIDTLLDYIEAMQNSVEDSVQKQKYGTLLSYFTNNKEALISYKRRGIDLPEPPEGKEYRQCGTAESNVFSALARRMKGCRACWSIHGGEHLAKLLTLYATNRLQDNYAILTRTPFDDQPPVSSPHTASAAKTPHTVGKGYNGVPTAQIPNLPWVKKTLGLKPLSEC